MKNVDLTDCWIDGKQLGMMREAEKSHITKSGSDGEDSDSLISSVNSSLPVPIKRAVKKHLQFESDNYLLHNTQSW